MEKDQFFLAVEFHLISVERMMEIEDHHLANTMVLNAVGKHQQQMLKLVAKCTKQDICIVSDYLPRRCLSTIHE